MTLSAGTVADSSPSRPHSVSVAAAVIAEIENGCGSTLITDEVAAPQSARWPSTMTATSGITFSTVVTSWTTPAA